MAQIVKRITSSGENRYDVRTRIGGRVVTRTFRRRKDADVYSNTVETDKLRGVVLDPRRSRQPLEVVAAAWLKARTSKRPSSLARDRAIIDHHVVPVLGDRPVGGITRADIQALVDSWTASVAPSTVGRQYSCLRAIFTWAEDSEMIARNPCRAVRLPQVRLVDRPALTVTQLNRLADALGEDRAAMMWIGAVLGLRWGEVAGLRVSSLDMLGGKVIVDRQLARSSTLEPPKSAAGTRTLACPTWLLDDLASLLGRRKLTAANADELVFVTNAGSPLNYTNWRQREWLPACETAGLAGLKFHDLRSLAATALIDSGANVKTTQTRLGHSSPQVTLALYARATAAADRLAADAVGDVFRPRDGRAMRNESNRT